MSNHVAYVAVPSPVVVAACVGYLAARNRRIKRNRERAIADLMLPHRGFFGRLFRPKPLTREEAIKDLQYSGQRVFSRWQAYEIEGGLWADKVEATLALARAFKEKDITVSSELGDLLAGFWPKEAP